MRSVLLRSFRSVSITTRTIIGLLHAETLEERDERNCLVLEMPYNDYLKQRAYVLYSKGLTPRGIVDALEGEGLRASRRGIAKLINRVTDTGSLERQPGSGRPSKITPKILQIVEEQMRRDDETTVVQLLKILRDKGHPLSESTILRSRLSLGWTFRGSAYCQMIRDANKTKRLEFPRQYVQEADTGFLNVIYTDETSIQLESHRRFACRKRGEQSRHKPK